MDKNITTQNKTNKLSKQEPAFVTDFCSALSLSVSTIASYRNDLCFFLSYLLGVIPSLDGVSLPDFPLDVFTLLDQDEIEKYIAYLKSARFLSAASVYAKIAAIKAFYNYLFNEQYTFNNPCKNLKISPGKKNASAVLSPSQIRFLFTGMRENKLFLIEGSNGENEVVAATELVKIRREPVILRNIAIFHLFLFCGLSITEMTALDISDVSLRNRTITIRKEKFDYEQIQFHDNEDVIKALTDYINGVPMPSVLSERFIVSGNTDYDWCKAQLRNVNFEKRLLKDRPGMDEEYYNAMRKLASALRTQGRSGLNPDHTEKALFISMRGKRMSKIMIQKMIREMLQTHLSFDQKNADINLLRRTCASMIVQDSDSIREIAGRINNRNVKGICESIRKK